jgi:hypothetical protein
MLIDISKIPDDRKFRELIVYFSKKCEMDKKFGATKLNKLLFYVDFLHFKQHGKAITGLAYQKLEHGPAPRALKPILSEMEGRDIEIRETLFHGKVQKRPIPLRDPDTSVFSTKELELIDTVISRFWNMSATEISNKSHEFIGWVAARLNETIPYAIALISFRDLTDAELAHGRRLEERACELQASH